MGEKKKNKKKGCLASFCVIVVLFIVLIAVASQSDSNDTSSESSSEDESSTVNSEESKDDERILYEDDNFKISYIDITDPNSGLTMYIMNLKLENKSENSVFISLEETYINDTQVQFLGGNLSFDGTLPGKKSICSFSFGYDKLGIKSIEDIKNIEFTIKLTDTDFSEVYLETDTIKIAL